MLKILLTSLVLMTSLYAQSYNTSLKNFKAAKELKRYFNTAYAYAIYPNIGKGGLILGLSFGKGRIYEKGAYVGNSSMTSLSLGAQLGGQAYSKLIFFRNKEALERFKQGSMEYDAEVNAMAATAGAIVKSSTIGATISASTNAVNRKELKPSYYNDIAIVVQPVGGLMFEASGGFENYSYSPK